MSSRNSQLSLCALVPYAPATTPSQRFRLEQWMPQLNARGIQVQLAPFLDQSAMRLLQQSGRYGRKGASLSWAFLRSGCHLASLHRYDVILIHRAMSVIGPAFLERLIPLFAKPIIYDFDDAIFLLHSSEANRRFGWLKCPGKTATLCRLGQQVVVGNQYLANYARQYNPRVTIVPSSVDTASFKPRPQSANGKKIVIGWTGSSTSQTYLEMFAPRLEKVLRRLDVEFRVHSDREPDLPGIPCVWRPWSAETEAEEIGAFDIGIMPMPDDKWAKGKCAMKALLYMALAIPAVCSAVGTNCEVIHHGQNGMLATRSDEWITHLENLVESPRLRKELGDAGRQTVEEHYSIHQCANRFAEVIHETASGKLTNPRI